MTFLSIVIPVYNVQDYIHRCIDSLIKQSLFKQIEVLLVDDGSMDSSGKICDEYANKYENIRVYHKENGGLSHARNFAIEYLNSDYVFFLDSDDMVAGSFLSDMKRIIDGDRPDVICFKCCYERKKEEYRLKGNKKITVNDNRKILDDLLKSKMGNQICFNVYAKSLFETIRFPNGRAYEDIATLYKLILQAQKIIKVNYSYYIYNLSNAGSITKISTVKNFEDMYLSVNEQVNAIGKYYKKFGIDTTYLKYYKLDKYIYIYLKLVREVIDSDESKNLKLLIENWLIRNWHTNFLKFRYYNIKKYLYFVIILLLKIRRKNRKNVQM